MGARWWRRTARSSSPVSARPLRLSFGRVAETYHRIRPAYSQPLLDRAQQALELPPSACVLDLAAGTGRLTSELARRRGAHLDPLVGDGPAAPGCRERASQRSLPPLWRSAQSAVGRRLRGLAVRAVARRAIRGRDARRR